MKKRSIASVIILSIVTFGIFELVWIWKAIGYLISENGDTSLSRGARFGLCFVEAGWIIFGLQANDQLNAIRAKKGMEQKNQQVVFLILGIVCTTAMIALFQNEYNQIAE